MVEKQQEICRVKHIRAKWGMGRYVKRSEAQFKRFDQQKTRKIKQSSNTV
ncbi:unnamed protein product [Porites evermanni]|uniref:Uncharacterized protein n=1 Tax=Porites evermanni TaxID=104178 RepID=A0ABN8LEF2_9CNID|nr:unnamed protein product [Porites evermanni]